MPVPLCLLLKVPDAALEFRVTTSPGCTPCKTAAEASILAVVVPSYTLSLAVTPVTVKTVAGVMFAVVLAVVDARV